ncbi:MAG: hypothetical protein J7623_26745 [Chitinophaga sp.]|uniref:hypothetical protein n=1 Tax=Chitinophaga sp. TaxID=1869181 RepID=UPI001B28CE30|nr:hypothetical protein [Chitinophaga sp.]MBO9732269.1 hypothetical protein [Chitinophaga sp.]
MKPCQLTSIIITLLFAVCYPVSAAGVVEKKQPGGVNDRSGLYVVEDTVSVAIKYQQQAHHLYHKKLYKRAIVQWKKVLHLQPGNAFAMFMLGKSYMGAGEATTGAAWCDKAILLGEKKDTLDKTICHSVEGF